MVAPGAVVRLADAHCSDVVYLALTAGLVFRHRRRLVGLARDGFRAPYAQLQEES